ncbi:Protein CURVATURE THYLAKOID 1B, chloroplastic isoform B [Glycine soja]|uniref:Cyanobacterial aminoacyl-tRNA synthetase CAAD domain-containing protein n=2 Tax=Glycine subgen. Soja TaxID=1462606 RepID=I1MKB6_SOYBN|nr:Protein CURVATURE THYLAKOID 1B, chloroplastic isoform B [Glycine soja]
MASTSSALTISSSSTLHDCKAPRQSPAASPQCVSLPSPLLHSQNCSWKTTAYCRSIARNVMAMATGEAPAEAAPTEVPEIVKTLQETWDKVDDKYAVSSLALVGVVALWGSVGLISVGYLNVYSLELFDYHCLLVMIICLRLSSAVTTSL